MGNGRLKRDYSQKHYSNSLFNGRNIALKKKQRDAKIKFLGIFLSGIAIIAGAVYVFYGNYFRIAIITVSGNEEIKAYEIADHINGRLNRSKIFPFYNYWLVNDKLSDDIKNNFYLKEVKLTKNFPNKIFIEVAEKEPKFILSSGGQDYILDDQGTSMGLLSEEKRDKFSGLLKIADNTQANASDTNQLISTKEIFVIYKALNFLDDNKIIFNHIEKNEFNELAIILSSGVKILFDTEENIDSQLGKLDSIEEDILTAKEYLDVRFGDKIYLK